MKKSKPDIQADSSPMASEPVAEYGVRSSSSSGRIAGRTVKEPVLANIVPEDVMRTIVADRIHMMEEGEASYVDGELGFAQVRERYGL